MFISFKIEVEPQATQKTLEVVGVDLGVKTLATLSTGENFKGTYSYRKLSTKLAGSPVVMVIRKIYTS